MVFVLMQKITWLAGISKKGGKISNMRVWEEIWVNWKNDMNKLFFNVEVTFGVQFLKRLDNKGKKKLKKWMLPLTTCL